jgi:hypothetical protein
MQNVGCVNYTQKYSASTNSKNVLAHGELQMEKIIYNQCVQFLQGTVNIS